MSDDILSGGRIDNSTDGPLPSKSDDRSRDILLEQKERQDQDAIGGTQFSPRPQPLPPIPEAPEVAPALPIVPSFDFSIAAPALEETREIARQTVVDVLKNVTINGQGPSFEGSTIAFNIPQERPASEAFIFQGIMVPQPLPQAQPFQIPTFQQPQQTEPALEIQSLVVEPPARQQEPARIEIEQTGTAGTIQAPTIEPVIPVPAQPQITAPEINIVQPASEARIEVARPILNTESQIQPQLDRGSEMVREIVREEVRETPQSQERAEVGTQEIPQQRNIDFERYATGTRNEITEPAPLPLSEYPPLGSQPIITPSKPPEVSTEIFGDTNQPFFVEPRQKTKTDFTDLGAAIEVEDGYFADPQITSIKPPRIRTSESLEDSLESTEESRPKQKREAILETGNEARGARDEGREPTNQKTPEVLENESFFARKIDVPIPVSLRRADGAGEVFAYFLAESLTGAPVLPKSEYFVGAAVPDGENLGDLLYWDPNVGNDGDWVVLDAPSSGQGQDPETQFLTFNGGLDWSDGPLPRGENKGDLLQWDPSAGSNGAWVVLDAPTNKGSILYWDEDNWNYLQPPSGATLHVLTVQNNNLAWTPTEDC